MREFFVQKKALLFTFLLAKALEIKALAMFRKNIGAIKYLLDIAEVM